MTKKEPDLDAVINTLKALAPVRRRQVVAEYDAGATKAGRPTLSESVKGKVMTLAQSSTFINVVQYTPGGSPAVANLVIQKPRTDKEAMVQELIEAPDPGGKAELSWTHKWTRDTYERAISRRRGHRQDRRHRRRQAGGPGDPRGLRPGPPRRHGRVQQGAGGGGRGGSDGRHPQGP